MRRRIALQGRVDAPGDFVEAPGHGQPVRSVGTDGYLHSIASLSFA